MSTTTQQSINTPTNEVMMVSGIQCNNCLRIQPTMPAEVFLNSNHKCKCEEESILNYDMEHFKDQFDLFLRTSKYCLLHVYHEYNSTVEISWTGHKNKDFKDFFKHMVKWEQENYINLDITKFGDWSVYIQFLSGSYRILKKIKNLPLYDGKHTIKNTFSKINNSITNYGKYKNKLIVQNIINDRLGGGEDRNLDKITQLYALLRSYEIYKNKNKDVEVNDINLIWDGIKFYYLKHLKDNKIINDDVNELIEDMDDEHQHEFHIYTDYLTLEIIKEIDYYIV